MSRHSAQKDSELSNIKTPDILTLPMIDSPLSSSKYCILHPQYSPQLEYAHPFDLAMDCPPLPPPATHVNKIVHPMRREYQSLFKSTDSERVAHLAHEPRFPIDLSVCVNNPQLLVDAGQENQPKWIGKLHVKSNGRRVIPIRRVFLLPKSVDSVLIVVFDPSNPFQMLFLFDILPTGLFGPNTVDSSSVALNPMIFDNFTGKNHSRSVDSITKLLRYYYDEVHLRWRSIFSGQDRFTETSTITEKKTIMRADGRAFVTTDIVTTTTTNTPTLDMYVKSVKPALECLMDHKYMTHSSSLISAFFCGTAHAVSKPLLIPGEMCPGCKRNEDIERSKALNEKRNPVYHNYMVITWLGRESVGSSGECGARLLELYNLCRQISYLRFLFSLGRDAFTDIINAMTQ